jgi:hypothetical protein
MPKLSPAALCIGLALAAPPSAGAVYKCSTIAGNTVYQDTPCDSKEAQSVVSLAMQQAPKPGQEPLPAQPAPQSSELGAAQKRAGSTSSDIRPSGSSGPAVQETRAGPPTHLLETGMSDTKVLNMRGWGKPKNIARSQGQDGWKEEWTYVTGATERTLLQFSNGKLVAINTDNGNPQASASQPVAVAAQSSAQPVTSAAASQPNAPSAARPVIASQAQVQPVSPASVAGLQARVQPVSPPIVVSQSQVQSVSPAVASSQPQAQPVSPSITASQSSVQSASPQVSTSQPHAQPGTPLTVSRSHVPPNPASELPQVAEAQLSPIEQQSSVVPNNPL